MGLARACALVACVMMVEGSVDSITSSTQLLKDNIKSTDAKLCHRPCKINVEPKRCHFRLTVEPLVTADGRVRLALNRSVPGPSLRVCVNDIVVAEVNNRIPDQELAIHWHGIQQKGTPYMDGVSMITQCPIGFGSTYKYAFRAAAAGTFFYHAHSATHQSDGVYGALVVSQPAPLDPQATLFDYDRSEEHTLLLAPIFPDLLTENLQDLTKIHPTALTVNDLTETYMISVTEGFGYRLRLVNAAAVECPVVVSVDSHELVAIASDGHPVAPASADSLLLYPGERMDAVLRASAGLGGYWLRVRGLGVCAGLVATAPVVYSGYNYTAMLHDFQSPLDTSSLLPPAAPLQGQALMAASEAPAMPAVRQVLLRVDRNTISFSDSDIDFRYMSDAMPKKHFFPAQLTTHDGKAVQINGKSFDYPPAPILVQPRDVPTTIRCLVGAETAQPEPHCLLTLEEKLNTHLELVLINEGAGSNDSYTFHMHGHSMQVLGTKNYLQPITAEMFQEWDRAGKVHRNLMAPSLKDTISLPNKGYAIVRLHLNNPGAWLLECRACGLSALPTAVLLQVPHQIPKTVSAVLPHCSSFRPPDVLLY